MGHRRLAGALAWIQLLQTCVEYTVHHHPHHHKAAALTKVWAATGSGDGGRVRRPGKEDCDQFKQRAWRLLRLDPYFRKAYLYAATFLAYEEEVKDPAEAVKMLATGVRYDPEYLFYKTYLGIIATMVAGDLEHMVNLMEEALQSPDSPVIVHILLARIYVQMGRNERALEILYALLDNPDAGFYWERARSQIEEIEAKVR